MEAFVRAEYQNPGRLVYPFEINYYPEEALNAQELRLADKKSKK